MSLNTRRFPFVAPLELGDRDVQIQIDTDNARWPNSRPESETDLAILDPMETAPAEIPQHTLYAGPDEIGKPAVLAGYGDSGFGDTGISVDASESIIKRAGLNRIEHFFEDRELKIRFDVDRADEAHNAFPIVGAESDLGLGEDEF